MAREYFCAYHSLIESLEPFGDAERGRLFTAALVYSREGTEPQLSGNERFLWPTMRAMIDRDRTAYEDKCRKNRESASLANASERQRTLPNATERYRTVANATQEKEEEKEEEKEKEESPKGDITRAKRFTPPALDEVAAYVREKGYAWDPEAFYDHYVSKGWKVGSQPMKDWRAAVRNWDRMEGKYTPRKDKREYGANNGPRDDAAAMSQLDRLMEKMGDG